MSQLNFDSHQSNKLVRRQRPQALYLNPLDFLRAGQLNFVQAEFNNLTRFVTDDSAGDCLNEFGLSQAGKLHLDPGQSPSLTRFVTDDSAGDYLNPHGLSQNRTVKLRPGQFQQPYSLYH